MLHLDPNVGPLEPKGKPRWHKCQIAGYGLYGTYVLKNLDGSLLLRDSPPSHLRQFRERGAKQRSHEFVTIVDHSLPEDVTEELAIGKDYRYLVQWSNGITSWEPYTQFDDVTAVTLYWRRRRDKKPPRDFMCPKQDPSRDSTSKGKRVSDPHVEKITDVLQMREKGSKQYEPNESVQMPQRKRSIVVATKKGSKRSKVGDLG